MDDADGSLSRNWSFASELSSVDDVCAEIRELFSRRELQDHLFAVELICREALNNAVIHGNKSDANKKVVCDLTVDDEQIVFRVTDEGSGFDWKRTLKQAARKCVSKKDVLPHGRGITIYKAFSDGVAFSESGNEVCVVRKRKRQAEPSGTVSIHKKPQRKARGLRGKRQND